MAHEPHAISAADNSRLLPRAVVCGLGVRRDVRGVLFVQRFMRGDRRTVLSAYLRHRRLRVLHNVDLAAESPSDRVADRATKPTSDRDTTANDRAPQAV